MLFWVAAYQIFQDSLRGGRKMRVLGSKNLFMRAAQTIAEAKADRSRSRKNGPYLKLMNGLVPRYCRR
jgi:hypothetical protein